MPELDIKQELDAGTLVNIKYLDPQHLLVDYKAILPIPIPLPLPCNAMNQDHHSPEVNLLTTGRMTKIKQASKLLTLAINYI